MPITFLGTSPDEYELKMHRLTIPLYLSRVSAGFPSPAQDYIEKSLDLNELCIQNPAATFFARVEGDSMIEAGMFPNDILVVDRSIQAEHGDIVVAGLYGELTVKELETKPIARLVPHNKAYQPIIIQDDSGFEVFGVVTNVVRRIIRRKNFKP